MIGFININKGAGMSSAFVVGKIKRHLGIKKCGHMGTLDPLATGVLPIALGNATRLFDYTLEKEKAYIANFTFGKTTNTLDSGGQVINNGGTVPTLEQVRIAASSMVGQVMQTPPKFSAKHINGVRSYKLAQSGAEFDVLPKLVSINKIEILRQIDQNTFECLIECGGGTYIRSIARDLGEKLCTYAYMSSLCRIKSGNFEIENALTLDEFLSAQNPSNYITLAHLAVNFEVVNLEQNVAGKLLVGIPQQTKLPNGFYKLFSNGFIGVGEVDMGVLKIRSRIM